MEKVIFYFPILFILSAAVLFSCSNSSNPVGPGNDGGEKWRLAISDSAVLISTEGEVAIYGYHYGVNFHINKQSQIIYDGEYHGILKIDEIQAPDYTVKVKSDAYLKVTNITGSYNENTNTLECKLTIQFVTGPTETTVCDKDGCRTRTGDGSIYSGATPHLAPHVQFTLKAKLGSTFKQDLAKGDINTYEIFTLKNFKE